MFFRIDHWLYVEYPANCAATIHCHKVCFWLLRLRGQFRNPGQFKFFHIENIISMINSSLGYRVVSKIKATFYSELAFRYWHRLLSFNIETTSPELHLFFILKLIIPSLLTRMMHNKLLCNSFLLTSIWTKVCRY